VAPRIAEAFGHTFWWGIGLLVVAVVPALLLPRRRPALPAAETHEPVPEAEAVVA
jgi:predicted cobalt transporter CbtA